VRPALPAQNNPHPILNPDRRQFTTPAPQMPTPAPAQNRAARQNPGVFRQEIPKFTRQDEREFTRPAMPVQRQAEIRTYPPPRAAEPRGPQRSYNNAALERTAPSVRSEPMTPAGPRVEARQAPPVQTAPPPQRGNSGASASRSTQQDNNSRQNR